MDDTTLKYLLRQKLENYEIPDASGDWAIIRHRLARRKQAKTVIFWLTASAAAVAAWFLLLHHPAGNVLPLPVEATVAALSPALPPVTSAETPPAAATPDKLPAVITAVTDTTPTTHAVESIAVNTTPASHAHKSISANEETGNEKAEKPEQTNAPDSSATLFPPAEEPEQPEKSKSKKWALALLTNQSGSIHSSGNPLDLNYSAEFHSPSSDFSNVAKEDLAVETTHHIPLSFGLTFRLYLTSHWAIESGVIYTYLSSEYKYNDGYRIKQQLHYLGLPLHGVYRFIDNKWLSVYASVGGMLEKGISANYTIINQGAQTGSRENVAGLQWSLNGQLGISYNLSKRFSLYAEPGIRYFVPDARQPESIRTERPFNFNAGFGIRTNF